MDAVGTWTEANAHWLGKSQAPRSIDDTCMANHEGDPRSAAEARDSRRWLIGVGISLTFGLFGATMALLAYSDRKGPSAPPAAKSPAAKSPAVKSPNQAEPSKDDRRKRDRR
jgi:hypothetical protein